MWSEELRLERTEIALCESEMRIKGNWLSLRSKDSQRSGTVEDFDFDLKFSHSKSSDLILVDFGFCM